MDRSTRIIIVSSWVLLIGCVIAWPVTSLTIAKHEPQFILGLSWFAIVYTAAQTLLQAYTKADVRSGSSELADRTLGDEQEPVG